MGPVGSTTPVENKTCDGNKFYNNSTEECECPADKPYFTGY